MLHTTFNELRNIGACPQGYGRLARYLGGVERYGRDTPIDIQVVLKSNGINDAVWSLLGTIEGDTGRRLSVMFGSDCAERVLRHFEMQRPFDTRPRQAIDTAREYAAGLAGGDLLEMACSASTLAEWAASGLAKFAAAAASAAARLGAASGAAKLAVSIAGESEKNWQELHFIELINAY